LPFYFPVKEECFENKNMPLWQLSLSLVLTHSKGTIHSSWITSLHI